MEIKIPDNYIYYIDRGLYDQKMKMIQMSFMLSNHVNDETDDFLKSDLFKRLHTELVTATAKKWCNENVIIKRLVGETPKKYILKDENTKILVEM